MSSPEPPEPPRPPVPPTEPLVPRAPRAPAQPPAAYVGPPVVERVPPGLPPAGPWWESPWPPVLTGILGLVIGALLGYTLGGKGETVTQAQRGGPALAQTVTRTTTVVRPQVVVHTVTAPAVTQTPLPANSANEERRAEAEANLKKVERENEELKRQAEGN
jgi:hypothetical protein